MKTLASIALLVVVILCKAGTCVTEPKKPQ